MAKYVRSGGKKKPKNTENVKPKSRFRGAYSPESFEVLMSEAKKALHDSDGNELKRKLGLIATKMAYDVRGLDVPLGFGKKHYCVLYRGDKYNLKG